MIDSELGFELDFTVNTGPLGKAERSLAAIDTLLGIVGIRMADAERRFHKFSSIDGVMSAAAKGGVSALSGALIGLGVAVGVAATAWIAFERISGKAFDAMGERSSTIRGYTQLLGGDKKQAGLEYYRAQEFAQKTDFSSETIEQSQARLLAQGFRGKDLYATLFSAADLAAIMPGNKNQTLERVTMAMSQIKAKGKLQGEELTQQLAEAGLNTMLVKQQLMKSLGLKSTADVDKKMGKGEISADVALPAIQRAILQQLGTTKAGEYAVSASGSLKALISNRDEGAKNLLKSFDADEALEGMDRYKKALTEQGKELTVTSETGKELSLVLQDLSNSALDIESTFTEFSTAFIQTFANSYLETLKDIGDTSDQWDSAAAGARDLGESLGKLGAVVAWTVHGVEAAVESLMIMKGKLFGGNPVAEKQSRDEELARQRAQAGKTRVTTASGAVTWVTDEEGLRWAREGKLSPADADKFLNAKTAPPTAGPGKPEPRAKASSGGGKGSGRQEKSGVTWGYQDMGDGGMPSAPPITAQQMIRSSSQAAMASVSAATSSAGQTNIFHINGYNRDKRELADEILQALAGVAGRVNRRPV